MDHGSSAEARIGTRCDSPADWTELSRFWLPRGILQIRPTGVPGGSSVSRSSEEMFDSDSSASAGGPSSGRACFTSWMWKNVVITTR